MSTTVAGVDGCRVGWVCVLRQVDEPFAETAFVARSFSEVLRHDLEPSIVAVDIPIGFPDCVTGPGRACDEAVRAKLGKRAMAVFAVPARPAIAETDYRRACAAALAHSEPPRQISIQMFHLFPKIREVDAEMTAERQNRVFECHPEAAFWAMNGFSPLHEPKKRRNRPNGPGLELRTSLLRSQGYSEDFLMGTRLPGAGVDDFLDACACSWTAARIHRGEAVRFPQHPPVDAKGLRMEILA